MSKLLPIAFALSAFALVSSGCDKKVADLCPTFTASASTPVQAGGTIELTAPDLENVAFYNWSGPNGFESTERNPVIENIHGFEGGRYTLELGITGGCRQTVKTDSVVIIIPNSPCTPTNNTGTISGQQINFYAISVGPKGGSYFITANGSGGDLTLEFAGTEKPVPGVYDVRPYGDARTRGTVSANFVASSSFWPASSGKLYVTVANGKVTATFCDIPVYNQTFYFNATASGRLTEK